MLVSEEDYAGLMSPFTSNIVRKLHVQMSLHLYAQTIGVVELFFAEPDEAITLKLMHKCFTVVGFSCCVWGKEPAIGHPLNTHLQ